MAGLLFVGWATDRFGSRKVYMLGMVLLSLASEYRLSRRSIGPCNVELSPTTVFLLVFAYNLPMLMMGNMLCGFPWGIYQTLTTAYAAEICPTAMRGYLTTWVSMCWGMGNFVSTGLSAVEVYLKKVFLISARRWNSSRISSASGRLGMEDAIHYSVGMAIASFLGRILCTRE